MDHRWGQVLKLAVLTTGRQDWGALWSICLKLQGNRGFIVQLLLGGMHCSRQFGETARIVKEAGLPACVELPWIPDHEVPPAPEQASAALKMVAQTLQRYESEALM